MVHDKLIALGGRQWQKNGHNRIYLNGSQLAAIITEFANSALSKTEIRNLDSGNVYYNVSEGRFHWQSNRDTNHYMPRIAKHLEIPVDSTQTGGYAEHEGATIHRESTGTWQEWDV